jgi:hypothetical protein
VTLATGASAGQTRPAFGAAYSFKGRICGR